MKINSFVSLSRLCILSSCFSKFWIKSVSTVYLKMLLNGFMVSRMLWAWLKYCWFWRSYALIILLGFRINFHSWDKFSIALGYFVESFGICNWFNCFCCCFYLLYFSFWKVFLMKPQDCCCFSLLVYWTKILCLELQGNFYKHHNI